MNKKTLSFLLPVVLVFGLNELFVFNSTFFFPSLGLVSLVIVFSIKKMIGKKEKVFWPTLIVSPLLFQLTTSFYGAILTSQFWLQFVIILNSVILFLYLQNIYYYFSFQAPERKRKLQKTILGSSFLAFFAIATAIYSLPIFLNLSFWWISVYLFIIGIIFLGQILIYQNRQTEDYLFWGINSLVLGELAGALLLLPLHYSVRGLLLAIFFYILTLLNIWRRENRLYVKNLRWLLIISLLIIFITLFLARWR